jgi:hypothetical protein
MRDRRLEPKRADHWLFQLPHPDFRREVAQQIHRSDSHERLIGLQILRELQPIQITTFDQPAVQQKLTEVASVSTDHLLIERRPGSLHLASRDLGREQICKRTARQAATLASCKQVVSRNLQNNFPDRLRVEGIDVIGAVATEEHEIVKGVAGNAIHEILFAGRQVSR